MVGGEEERVAGLPLLGYGRGQSHLAGGAGRNPLLDYSDYYCAHPT